MSKALKPKKEKIPKILSRFRDFFVMNIGPANVYVTLEEK